MIDRLPSGNPAENDKQFDRAWQAFEADLLAALAPELPGATVWGWGDDNLVLRIERRFYAVDLPVAQAIVRLHRASKENNHGTR